MSVFPKVVIVLGISGAVVVPFMVLEQKGNGQQDGPTSYYLSSPSGPVSPKSAAPLLQNQTNSYNQPSSPLLAGEQSSKKKKPSKKPVIRVGREPVQLGNRTLRMLRDTQPPKINIIIPIDPSYVETEWTTVRAKSETGVRLNAGNRPLLETAKGIYVGKVNLQLGKNLLTIKARDQAGNTSEATVTVTRIDQKKIRRMKDRLKGLLSQLDEIQKLSQEMDTRTENLIREINNTHDADTINRLSREQQEIRKTKLILQAEIKLAIKVIDSLLTKL